MKGPDNDKCDPVGVGHRFRNEVEAASAQRFFRSRLDDLEGDLDNIQDFVDQGEIVALTDDLEKFCDSLKLELEDTTVVEPRPTHYFN